MFSRNLWAFQIKLWKSDSCHKSAVKCNEQWQNTALTRSAVILLASRPCKEDLPFLLLPGTPLCTPWIHRAYSKFHAKWSPSTMCSSICTTKSCRLVSLIIFAKTHPKADYTPILPITVNFMTVRSNLSNYLYTSCLTNIYC